MRLFGHQNVFYDLHSEYQFLDLNESLFVQKIFENLDKFWNGEFSNFEFYIYSSHKEKKEPLSSLKESSKNKVLIYLSDETGEIPEDLSPHYFAIFKSYIGDKPTLSKNIFPFPLGYVKGVPKLKIKAPSERAINVFFRGNINDNRIDFYRSFSKFKHFLPNSSTWRGVTYRKVLLRLGNDFSDFFPNSIVIFNNSFKSGFSLDKYGEILSESKIVLCPKGFDRTECFRHFEAMRAGCVLISEKLPNIEFYKGSPILEVDNWKEGINLAKSLINDPLRIKQIHEDTINWWENKCSEHASANYIMNKIKSLELSPTP
jgi:hypothetical protein